MKNYENLAKKVEKKYAQRDRKKRKRMKVNGKQVFALQEMMQKTAGKRIQKIKKK